MLLTRHGCESAAPANGNPSRASSLRADIPRHVDPVIARALTKDPAARFGPAKEMVSALHEAQKQIQEPPATVAGKKPQKQVWRRLAPLAAGILVVLALVAWFVTKKESASNFAHRKSIAILPITSINKSSEDEEFAEGLHDHLITQISSIRDLMVISRQSVMQYKGTQKRSREIANELGAEMLMESSVQRVGTRIRMQAQLIDGATEGHLWANTFDRDYLDIFGVQADLAEKIAAGLQATITPEEKAALERPLTKNADALDAYIKGCNLWATAFTKEGNLRAAVLLDQAAKLDTQFAQAYAMAAHVHTNIYAQLTWDSSPERLEKAEEALRIAKRLGPDLPETHLASGSYLRLITKDFAGAAREFQSALALRPNDYEALHELGFIHVQLRQLDKALSTFERCEALNPLAGTGGMDARRVAWGMRRWADARRLSERYLSLHPDDPLAYVYHVQLLVSGFGDIRGAIRTIEDARKWGESRPWTDTREGGTDIIDAVHAYVAFIERDYEAASSLAMKGRAWFRFSGLPYHVLLANRDKAEIREFIDSIASRNSAAVKRDSTNGGAWLRIALARAIRGDRESATAAAERAAQYQPPFNDPWLQREFYPEWLASVLILTGDHDGALGLLEDLMARPSWVTVWKLRLDPIYDPLRDTPRFKALLEKYR